MAQVKVFGFEELDRLFRALGDVPWEVTRQALEEMAKVGEHAVVSTGTALGIYDSTSRVHVLDSITHTKPKQNEDGGGYCVVTFKGKRRRGSTVTPETLIAFENEYGNRHQTARPFVRLAAVQHGEEISAPGVKALGAWIDQTLKDR